MMSAHIFDRFIYDDSLSVTDDVRVRCRCGWLSAWTDNTNDAAMMLNRHRAAAS